MKAYQVCVENKRENRYKSMGVNNRFSNKRRAINWCKQLNKRYSFMGHHIVVEIDI